MADLARLKPFGVGNTEPVFMSKNVGIVSANAVGKENQHLQLKLYQNDKYYKAMLFGEGALLPEFTAGKQIDIAYVIKENRFNNNYTIDLIIKDWRNSTN